MSCDEWKYGRMRKKALNKDSSHASASRRDRGNTIIVQTVYANIYPPASPPKSGTSGIYHFDSGSQTAVTVSAPVCKGQGIGKLCVFTLQVYPRNVERQRSAIPADLLLPTSQNRRKEEKDGYWKSRKERGRLLGEIIPFCGKKRNNRKTEENEISVPRAALLRNF